MILHGIAFTLCCFFGVTSILLLMGYLAAGLGGSSPNVRWKLFWATNASLLLFAVCGLMSRGN
jgi:hypothetical protein